MFTLLLLHLLASLIAITATDDFQLTLRRYVIGFHITMPADAAITLASPIRHYFIAAYAIDATAAFFHAYAVTIRRICRCRLRLFTDTLYIRHLR